MMMPRRFYLPFKREGLIWFAISVAMLVTALLKGINLVTLLASLMVSVVFLNFILARRQLRQLRVQRVLTEPAFAGTPCLIHLRMDNIGKRSVFGVSVREDDAVNQHAGFVTRLDPGVAEHSTFRAIFPTRGRHLLSGVELGCGYPLGLVRLRRRLDANGEEVIVFPKLGILRKGLLRRFLSRHSKSVGQGRGASRPHPGAQSEFHGLRAFRPGDSPRCIHWRTTARRGELMVREFEELPDEHLVLLVSLSTDHASAPDDVLVEKIVSLAATICWEWCRQKGDRMVLAIAGANPEIVAGVTGMPLAMSMLEALATAAKPKDEKGDEYLQNLVEADLPKGPMLLISAGNADLAGLIGRGLGRAVAHIDVGQHEEAEFFEFEREEIDFVR